MHTCDVILDTAVASTDCITQDLALRSYVFRELMVQPLYGWLYSIRHLYAGAGSYWQQLGGYDIYSRTQLTMYIKSSHVNQLTAMGNHIVFHAFTSTKAGTWFSDPGVMQGWVGLGGGYIPR